MKVLTALVLACAALAVPTPPGIPSPSTARTLLAGLEVAQPESGRGYSRKKFPHWETIRGTCNTREFVLERDGRNVTVDDDCRAVSGSWESPYDGEVWTDAGDIDIDHMVPLKNAWISGAASWTTEQRRGFANDVTRPQLWAVTDSVNRAKSDSSPDEWLPPLDGFRCTYVRSWIQVKSHYELSVTAEEKRAMAGVLDAC
ncbi:hypothetical protein CDD83_9358 [Cordyceps sp. RAO-2017]|nr:hypothetical protein CDD83_9358 [Cordyceps sp. RAO-2017]